MCRKDKREYLGSKSVHELEKNGVKKKIAHFIIKE